MLAGGGCQPSAASARANEMRPAARRRASHSRRSTASAAASERAECGARVVEQLLDTAAIARLGTAAASATRCAAPRRGVRARELLVARRGEERAAKPAAESRVRRVRDRSNVKRVDRGADRRLGSERPALGPAGCGAGIELWLPPAARSRHAAAPSSARRWRRVRADRRRAVASPNANAARNSSAASASRAARARAAHRRRRALLDRRAARREPREQRRRARDRRPSRSARRAGHARRDVLAPTPLRARPDRSSRARRATRDSCGTSEKRAVVDLICRGALRRRVDLPAVQQLPRGGRPLRRACVADQRRCSRRIRRRRAATARATDSPSAPGRARRRARARARRAMPRTT